MASWVNIGKCPVHHIRICPRERYGRSHRLRHGGVTGGASAAIFLISWTRRYEHSDPLGDPGTSLTTAVSNNVLRREPLPTVRVCARGFGFLKTKKSKNLDGFFTCRVRSHSYPPLLHTKRRPAHLCSKRQGRLVTSQGCTPQASPCAWHYAESTAGLRSDSSKSDCGL